jgi:hypothetical protein
VGGVAEFFTEFAELALKAVFLGGVQGPLQGELALQVRTHLVDKVQKEVRLVQRQQISLLETVEIQSVLVIDTADLLKGTVQLR